METELSNVHQAMQSAILEAKEDSQMVTASLKLPTHIKAQADALCARHGVTLSAHLRNCCVHLVQDYNGVTEQKGS